MNAEVFGPHTPLILGTYEEELHAVFEVLRQTNPSYVLNIGGGAGYYAIGCAAIWGVPNVIVYESLEYGRQIIRNSARNNFISDTCEIRGECTESELFNLLKACAPSILIMDVEGAELDLLSYRVRSRLCDSHIVIESHDFARPGCTEILRNWFERTHHVRLIESRRRRCKDFPCKIPIPCAIKLRLMDERRPQPMFWLLAFPKRQPIEA
ncbi:MAG: hypothetical protein MN733_33510 [Nitrososphaera sp.]|nr:hypothetical protein [Nitrososphaera sp.]